MQRNTLTKLHEITKKVNEAKELTAELLRTAQDRYNDRLHKCDREGRSVELKEKVLWDEVFYLGPNCQAGKILTKEHPEVFNAFAEQEKLAEELKKFCLLELGVDYTALTISDYLKMTEQLFELMLGERGLPTKSPIQMGEEGINNSDQQ